MLSIIIIKSSTTIVSNYRLVTDHIGFLQEYLKKVLEI